MSNGTTRIFGVPVRVFRRRRAWWWRPLAWVRKRRAVGPYGTRTEAIRDCAALLYSKPYLRTSLAARPWGRAS